MTSDQTYYDNIKTGIAYKVFRVKDGKLYPPMVANPGGAATPVGTWLEAAEGEFAGLSKTGRPQVKQAKSKETLAYRPGWHLGDTPRATQFDRTNKLTGEPEFPKDFIWAKCLYVMNIEYQEEAHQAGLGERNLKYTVLPETATADDGDIYYILQFNWGKDKDGNPRYFNVTFNDDLDLHIDGYPFEHLMSDYDNSDYVRKEIYNYFLSDNESVITDIIRSGKSKGRALVKVFNHTYGDIKHIPTDGYYRYRTNPKPDTVPWVITGAMKVLELLGDDEVNDILRAEGIPPIHRQGGDKTVAEIMRTSK